MVHPGIKGDEVFTMAAELKIAEPVVLILHGNSTHARTIAEDLVRTGYSENVMPQAEGVTQGPMDAHEVADLLLKHAGNGGAFVAEVLENKIMQMDYDIVELMKDKIGFASFINDGEMMKFTTAYDESNSLSFCAHDGTEVLVCGPTGEIAFRAAQMVNVMLMAHLVLPILGHMQGYGKLDESCLAINLLHGSADEPRVAAEAIRALRRAKSKKGNWLISVLWHRPELRELARRVHQELMAL